MTRHFVLQSSVDPTWQSANTALAVDYGRFVCAAYAMGEGTPDQPPPAAPGLPQGWTVIADIYMTDFVFAEDKEPTHYGLLATNDRHDYVLAIRGTVGLKEWWADLTSLDLVPCTFKTSTTVFGQVGFGFLAIYNTLHPIARHVQDAGARTAAVASQAHVSFAAAIHAIIRDDVATRGAVAPATAATPTVTVVGHSLGSALATLYTLDRHTGPDNFPARRLCTFASPMVGDAVFRACFQSVFLNGDADRCWRFYISSDIVPQVPPSALGFVPVDQGIELKLGWDTSWWYWPCAHSLSSYLHVLDPSWPLASACTGADPATDRCQVPKVPPSPGP